MVSPNPYASADNAGFLRPRRSFSLTPSDTGDGWPLASALAGDNDWAVVVATGPSAEDADYTQCRQGPIRIICNSAARNQKLLADFAPNILCFGDPVFHSGPSSYAKGFRDDLIAAAETLPELVPVVPEHYRSLVITNQPSLRGRIYGLTLDACFMRVAAQFQAATVRRTGNVLTQQMLPVAFQFKPTGVSLFGCDGRNPQEKCFWSHGKRVQYSDGLMNSVFESPPAFFRDVGCTDYFKRHCAEVAGRAHAVAKRGVSIDALILSHSPILRSRFSSP